MSPTEKIIDKLKKLHNMAEGAAAVGNEAEAQAFAEAFQRMLNQHKLSMSDIDWNNLAKEEPVAEHHVDFNKYPEFEVKRSSVQWETILASIIAEAHYCQVIRYTGSNKFLLVGRKTDAEVAEYTIMTLLRAADRISVREYGAYYRKCQAAGDVKRARGFKDAFLLGFINRIKERYDLARNGDGSSMALVRIAREKKAVDDFMKAQFEKSRAEGGYQALQSRKKWSFNEAGRRRGREVADGMDIDGKAMQGGRVQGQLS